MIELLQCYRRDMHEPHVYQAETDLAGAGSSQFCPGMDMHGLSGAYRIGRGGGGPDPSIPPCPVCGAHGGGGHGGFCPNK
jgi:hypothetical protein